MNVKFLRIVFVLSAAISALAVFPLAAQDKDLTPLESTDVVHNESSPSDDKGPTVDHETRSRNLRDSVSLHVKSAPITNHSPKTKAIESKNAIEEEDALSFNFLYYIIQKFKFSDLIEE